MSEAKRETFGSRFAVIMAFAGSAIGLGNIWRFPYLAGEGGGAIFVLVFLVATLLLSLPIFIAESVIGRRSRSGCLGAIRRLSSHRGWRVFGFLSVFTPLFILSYYSVVGGWSLDFLIKALGARFALVEPSEAGAMFGAFAHGTAGPLAAFTGFLALSCIIPAFGVTAGIERFNKVSIPVLFVIVVAVALYSMSLPGASAGVEYLLKPDWSKLSLRTCADAVGQSFYALSLGMGIIITYSSYMERGENITASAFGTAISALMFSILAGLAILPAVFAAGIEPGAGPGLIFETLPFIFSTMSEAMPVAGIAVSILFFLTVLVAALTSSISLAEVGIAYLVEERGLPRKRAALICFVAVWALGLCSALSMGPLSGVHIFGMPIFDAFDRISSNFLMMAGALLGVLFVGFAMRREDVLDELSSHGTIRRGEGLNKLVYFLIKWIAPVVILFIFVSNFIL